METQAVAVVLPFNSQACSYSCCAHGPPARISSWMLDYMSPSTGRTGEQERRRETRGAVTRREEAIYRIDRPLFNFPNMIFQNVQERSASRVPPRTWMLGRSGCIAIERKEKGVGLYQGYGRT